MYFAIKPLTAVEMESTVADEGKALVARSGHAAWEDVAAEPLTDLLLPADSVPTERVVGVQDQASVDMNGNDLRVVAGKAKGRANGGNLLVMAGSADEIGVGGNLVLSGGATEGVGRVLSATVSYGGEGYSIDDVVTLVGGNNDTTVRVTLVDEGGGVTDVALVTSGGGWPGPLTSVAVTGGQGQNLTLDIAVPMNNGTIIFDTDLGNTAIQFAGDDYGSQIEIGIAGRTTQMVTGNSLVLTAGQGGAKGIIECILKIDENNRGTGYVVQDVLTIDGGDANATFSVGEVDEAGGVVVGYLGETGTGYYQTQYSVPVSGGAGQGCRVWVSVLEGAGGSVSVQAGVGGGNDAGPQPASLYLFGANLASGKFGPTNNGGTGELYAGNAALVSRGTGGNFLVVGGVGGAFGGAGGMVSFVAGDGAGGGSYQNSFGNGGSLQFQAGGGVGDGYAGGNIEFAAGRADVGATGGKLLFRSGGPHMASGGVYLDTLAASALRTLRAPDLDGCLALRNLQVVGAEDDYTITPDANGYWSEELICFNVSNPAELQLPPAIGSGLVLIVKNLNSPVTILPVEGDGIDGGTEMGLNVGEAVTLCDGMLAGWLIISKLTVLS